MESPPHQRRDVVEYFLAESPESTVVHHAEKVASERIYGNRHDVWDVDSSDGRWWVITNPTNLYPQETAQTPSMDHALALHIGVVARVADRQHYDAPVDGPPRDYISKAWRKFEQAGDALSTSDEAEDFQSVGMRLREALISFVRDTAGEVALLDDQESPKRADFKSWAELLVHVASPGPGGAEIRSYLRVTSRETWDLVSWLTHASNATRFDAETAFGATGHLLSTFSLALLRQTRGEPARCPDCGSYLIVTENYRDDEGMIMVETFQRCEACEAIFEHELKARGT